MKKLIILTILLTCSWHVLLAQPTMTLYQMHDINQSNSLNPAVPISCGWVVSFPALGGISLRAGSPISYNNLGAGDNTLNTTDLIPHLRNKNALTTSATINLITIGYRAERTFYQFTVNERFSQVSSISKDPIEMLLRGNAGYVGQTVESAPSINALYYREYAFNVARELDPTLWVGARAKLLFGRMSLSSVNNKLDFYTDPGTYNLQLKSDVLVRGSIPGKVSIDPVTGKVDDFEADVSANDFIFKPTNIGAGIDLGVTKDFENGVQLSASLLNVGFIGWSKNLHTFRQKGTISFNGPFAAINELDALVDTIKSFAKLDYSQESYTQMLSPMFMAGANYPVADFLRVGVTGMVEFQPNTLPWALTATAFSQDLPIVDLGLSYTITPSSYFNVGFGLGARLGAFNFHLLTDNVLAMFKPFDARYATVQFGINFRFGCGNGDDSTPTALPCPAYK